MHSYAKRLPATVSAFNSTSAYLGRERVRRLDAIDTSEVKPEVGTGIERALLCP